ncbi:MAG: VWA domain-containing protein, partial [Acidobacteriota bacterium]
MQKSILAIIFLLFSLNNLIAQTPTPTATPSPKPVSNDEDVVKISTTLIQIDVTVTDKSGKIVTDLKPEEFEVYENGEKQPITNFSFISSVSEAKPSPTPKPDKNTVTAPIPSFQLRPEQVRRTVALVVDDLGLSFESIYYVRRALKKFVDEQMQPNDLVAIIRTGSGVGALQQFTSDKNQLYAAIEKIRWNAQGRSGISAFAPIEEDPITEEETEEDTAGIRDSEKEFNEFREDIFSVGTLGAINFVVKGMQELPGKKSIMLFSDGFVVCTPDSPDRCSRILDSLRELTDLCNRASVTIYTQDA